MDAQPFQVFLLSLFVDTKLFQVFLPTIAKKCYLIQIYPAGVSIFTSSDDMEAYTPPEKDDRDEVTTVQVLLLGNRDELKVVDGQEFTLLGSVSKDLSGPAACSALEDA